MLAAVAYGVVHDHLTATISRQYFLYGKGLAGDTRPFRWAVTVLAARASFGVGLLAGVVLLVANNPRPERTPPPLPYRALMKLSLVPLAFAGLTALVAGAVNLIAHVGSAQASELLPVSESVPQRVQAFTVVWAIHAGSYAGAQCGTIVTALLVVARRRKRG
jgi:hypothetical protein